MYFRNLNSDCQWAETKSCDWFSCSPAVIGQRRIWGKGHIEDREELLWLKGLTTLCCASAEMRGNILWYMLPVIVYTLYTLTTVAAILFSQEENLRCGFVCACACVCVAAWLCVCVCLIYFDNALESKYLSKKAMVVLLWHVSVHNTIPVGYKLTLTHNLSSWLSTQTASLHWVLASWPAAKLENNKVWVQIKDTLDAPSLSHTQLSIYRVPRHSTTQTPYPLIPVTSPCLAIVPETTWEPMLPEAVFYVRSASLHAWKKIKRKVQIREMQM